MRDHMVFGAAVAIILSTAPQVARAEWTICNRSAEELKVAIAYANLSGQIVTHGWVAAAARQSYKQTKLVIGTLPICTRKPAAAQHTFKVTRVFARQMLLLNIDQHRTVL